MLKVLPLEIVRFWHCAVAVKEIVCPAAMVTISPGPGTPVPLQVASDDQFPVAIEV